MNTNVLEEVGLSKGEASVYLSLLKLGETKVGSIIEKSGMASSAVHNSVNSLVEKGLVSYIKKGKIKYYIAASPKQIIDFIDVKKQDFQKVLPELELQRQKIKNIQEAEIFEGMRGIIAMLNILIDDTKKGDEYMFFPVNVKEMNKEIQEFFEMYDVKRKAKGLVIKGLAPKELKPLFVKRKMLKMHYVNFPIPSNISICKDKVAMFSWG
ncbi:MAG: helix-turn-helix domain-containing protein, partial [Nanoarchaeota archaeon]